MEHGLLHKHRPGSLMSHDIPGAMPKALIGKGKRIENFYRQDEKKTYIGGPASLKPTTLKKYNFDGVNNYQPQINPF